MSDEPREILNIEEAAALLGVSVKTFNKVLHAENMPARKIGREWKFSRRALIEWVGSGVSADFYRETTSTPENGARRNAAPAQQGRPARQERPPARARRTDGWRIEFD